MQASLGACEFLPGVFFKRFSQGNCDRAEPGSLEEEEEEEESTPEVLTRVPRGSRAQ